MKFIGWFAAGAICALCQTPPSDSFVKEVDVSRLVGAAAVPQAPERVVAEVDGRKITAGELHRFFLSLPPNLQEKYAQDRKDFVLRYALIRKLADMALEEKLDQKFPYKEQLEIARMNILMEAKLGEYANSVEVSDEQAAKYLKEHALEFRELRTKGINIMLTRSDAKQIAEKLVQQWRRGEDMEKAVAEARGDQPATVVLLDAGWFNRRSSIDENVRKDVLAAKVGDVLGPYTFPNSIWILRIEEERTESLESAKETVREELRKKALMDWIDAARKNLSLKVTDESYFQTAPSR